MNKKDILSHIDHTQLKAVSTWNDIQTLCQEAETYKVASVCVPPCYIKRIADAFPSLNICTVIGFPLGYSVTAAKVLEAKQAIADGASEIDMVVNISDVKNQDFDAVKKEIQVVRDATAGKILKVIVETCYLTDAEKIKLCEIVTQVGADYIKTSTGFGTNGATIEDVRLFKAHIGEHVKIKAAGGVRSIEDLERFFEEGCDRIGTSSAVALIKDMPAGDY